MLISVQCLTLVSITSCRQCVIIVISHEYVTRPTLDRAAAAADTCVSMVTAAGSIADHCTAVSSVSVTQLMYILHYSQLMHSRLLSQLQQLTAHQRCA